MEKVVGIGGVFFKARDAATLRAWYARTLGIDLHEWGGAVFEGGQTAWSVFDHTTSYFGSQQQTFMINFRVRDLDAMLEQVRAAGADVIEGIQVESNGRFGWAVDPEGNRIELWEPA